MADPTPTSVPTAPHPDLSPPQGSSEIDALRARQAFTAQHPSSAGVTVLPQGQRRTINRFAGARYTLNKQAMMLGSAEALLTDEFKRQHAGWKFEWPIADADETRMNLKNGFYKPVPPEAIRKDLDFAIVGDTLTVMGNCVSWKRHLLVAVPYEVWYETNVAPADYAMERTATGESTADELNSAFGHAGYRAEVRSFEDPRPEKIF